MTQFESFGFIKEKMPLVNTSLKDIIDLGGGIAQVWKNYQLNPAATLNDLDERIETALELALGLPVNFLTNNLIKFTRDTSVAGKPALKMEVSLIRNFVKQLAINLDLRDLPTPIAALSSLVDVRGSGVIDARAAATF